MARQLSQLWKQLLRRKLYKGNRVCIQNAKAFRYVEIFDPGGVEEDG